jgi:hypothetical protein
VQNYTHERCSVKETGQVSKHEWLVDITVMPTCARAHVCVPILANVMPTYARSNTVYLINQPSYYYISNIIQYSLINYQTDNKAFSKS